MLEETPTVRRGYLHGFTILRVVGFKFSRYYALCSSWNYFDPCGKTSGGEDSPTSKVFPGGEYNLYIYSKLQKSALK